MQTFSILQQLIQISDCTDSLPQQNEQYSGWSCDWQSYWCTPPTPQCCVASGCNSTHVLHTLFQGPQDQLTSFYSENALPSSTEIKALLISIQTLKILHEWPDKTNQNKTKHFNNFFEFSQSKNVCIIFLYIYFFSFYNPLWKRLVEFIRQIDVSVQACEPVKEQISYT